MDVLFGRGREHPDQFIGPGGVAVLKRPVAVGFHPLAIDVVLINPGHGCGGHTVSSFASAIRPEVSEPTEVRSLRGTINLADGPAGVNEPAAEGEMRVMARWRVRLEAITAGAVGWLAPAAQERTAPRAPQRPNRDPASAGYGHRACRSDSARGKPESASWLPRSPGPTCRSARPNKRLRGRAPTESPGSGRGWEPSGRGRGGAPCCASWRSFSSPACQWFLQRS